MSKPSAPGGAGKRNNQRSVWSLVGGLAIAMFGFAFALVPLYDVFCDITGINGKTADVPAASSMTIDTQRQVTVEFVAYINPGMEWTFEPEVRRVVVNPGQTQTINYAARNLTRYASIGQAVPSVTPGLGAQYFNKIECFCFNRQPLEAGGVGAAASRVLCRSGATGGYSYPDVGIHLIQRPADCHGTNAMRLKDGESIH